MSAYDSTTTAGSGKRGWFTRFLDTVEFLGNLLPHPVTLFAMFALAVVLGSGIAAYFDVSALDPRPEGTAGRAADGVIRVVNLVSVEGLQRIVSNLVTNFTNFPPLGVVLVALAGPAINIILAFFAAWALRWIDFLPETAPTVSS